MDCQDCKKMISQFLDDQLGQKKQDLMRQHLAHCPECAQSLESMTQIVKLMHTMDDVNPPLDFSQKVNARLDKKSFTEKMIGMMQNLFSSRVRVRIAAVMATLVIAVIATNQTKIALQKQTLNGIIPEQIETRGGENINDAEKAEVPWDLESVQIKKIESAEKGKIAKSYTQKPKLNLIGTEQSQQKSDLQVGDKMSPASIREEKTVEFQENDTLAFKEQKLEVLKENQHQAVIKLKPGNFIKANQEQSWQLTPYEKKENIELLADIISRFKVKDMLYGRICRFSVRFGQLSALISEFEKIGKLNMQTPFPLLRPEAYALNQGGFNPLVLEEKIQIKLIILEAIPVN